MMSQSHLEMLVPEEILPEAQWLCEVLFQRHIGATVRVIGTGDKSVTIQTHGKSISLPSWIIQSFRTRAAGSGLPANLTVTWWTPSIRGWDHGRIPVLGADPYVHEHDKTIEVNVDILGTLYFFLSRHEELLSGARDEHGRFPGRESLAGKNGVLDQPIVDQHAAFLRQLLCVASNHDFRRINDSAIEVSCDVDTPFDCAATSPLRLVLGTGADIVKRRQPGVAARRLLNAIGQPFGVSQFDPYDTFDWYFDAVRSTNRRFTMFFIARGDRPHRLDGCYDVESPRIRALIKRTLDEGHEVGLHGSYRAGLNTDLLLGETQRLARAMGTEQMPRVYRQHFLRWDPHVTPRALSALGYRADASGGFADLPGFRFGTAVAFNAYDISTRRQLPIEIRPLILMECTVIASRYMGLGYTEEAYATMARIRDRTMAFGGTFSILWHNSHLTTAADRAMLTSLLV